MKVSRISSTIARLAFIMSVSYATAGFAETPVLSYAPIVKKVSPGVGTIVSTVRMDKTRLEKYRALSKAEQDRLKEVASVFESKEGVFEMYAHGSGFIIDADGHMVTNHHVVAAPPDEANPDRSLADSCFVLLGNSSTWRPAKIVGVDSATDIAVLKLEMKNPPVTIWGDSATLQPGDVVLAIGTPQELELNQTVTMGIVSALGRSGGDLKYEDFIQTDAAINGGNSGGPLINTNGEVVGINQSILLGGVTTTDGQAASDPNGGSLRSSGNIGIGFAIPSRLAKNVVAELISTGTVRRGFLGIKVEKVEASLGDLSTDAGLSAGGMRVTSILRGSPAEKSGIQEGDMLLNFNGESVLSSQQLHLMVSLTKPGATVDLLVLRKGKPETLKLAMGDLSTSAYSAIGYHPGNQQIPQLEGVEIVEVPARRDFRSKGGGGESGFLVISAVSPGSAAAKAGLRPDTRILEVAGVPVSNANEFIQVAVTSVRDGQLLLKVASRAGEQEIVVPVITPGNRP